MGGRGRGRSRGGRGSSGGRGNYNSGWNHGGGFQNNQFGSNAFGGQRGRGGHSSRGRGRGRHSIGQDLQEQHPEVEYLWRLNKHKGMVTCLVFDYNTRVMYTGSEDGTVNCYQYVDPKQAPGNPKQRFVEADPFSNPMPGPVTGLAVLPSGQLFVTYTASQQPLTSKLLCVNTKQELPIDGAKIEHIIISASTEAPSIWMGGTDGGVFVVDLQPGPDGAMAMVAKGRLAAANGGHVAAVSHLCEFTITQGDAQHSVLISGDIQGCLRVWDMSNGSVLQAMDRVHGSAITGLLGYNEYIISASLDGLLRVWQLNAPPQPQAIFAPHPACEYRPAVAGGMMASAPQAVLSLSGARSTSGCDTLMVARQGTNTAELVAMNATFDWQGTLARVGDVRVFMNIDVPSTGERLVITGDAKGMVTVFRWR